MSYKIKSLMYLLAFVLSALAYYYSETTEKQESPMASSEVLADTQLAEGADFTP